MKAIMVMFDSLNRRMLAPYGCDWVQTRNFSRLAERAVTFDCNYVGSMPCIPARRELHTGRCNFLHRSWGPMEPFDDSMPELLKKNGVYSHLVSDHQHYWEDGGCTYHTRYSSWEISRGQEGDLWKVLPELIQGSDRKAKGYASIMDQLMKHDAVNRKFMDCEAKMPQAVTFKAGLEFIAANHETDNWFLQIETFDPHEPFFTQEEYKKLYPHEYDGPMGDWPPYFQVTEGKDAVQHVRSEYAALVTMCDRYLGKVLDAMTEYGLWEDTMLIVNTDHGYLLGEHGWWSKTVMPIYEEIARTPLFIYDPRCKIQGVHRDALTQTIDIPATILEFFQIPLPQEMQGRSLRPVIESNQSIRDYALFGYHGAHINITDGRWVYMMAPDSRKGLYEYTLMPTHMRAMFSHAELHDIRLQEPFSFTKGCRTMKIKAGFGMTDPANFGSRLYDLLKDPKQEHPLDEREKEAEMANHLIRLMKMNDSPKELFARFGLPEEGMITCKEVEALRKAAKEDRVPKVLESYQWTTGAVNMYHALMRFMPAEKENEIIRALQVQVKENRIGEDELLTLIDVVVPAASKEMVSYFALLNSRTE
jgi:arylsulfatase A-like enzyme